MEFFFPDSQDQIDPSFDFLTEERSIFHVRQRDDHYAHEALASIPFDGLLVSKAMVDGRPGATGRYSEPQRQRLYREGVRRFFRLEEPASRLKTMGDCGAFSYIKDELPPYSPDEVIDFYDSCGLDIGISVDHVIFGFDSRADSDAEHPQRAAWLHRREITLELASEFRRRARARRVRFEPVGVAQGWSPASYADSVRSLTAMGYRRIALGGMVPLKTAEILLSLAAIDAVRKPGVQLHLLGISRTENLVAFEGYGVTSFDSTSPFRRAFKDDTDNYYAGDRTYTALRIPQVEGNPKLKAAIRAGRLEQEAAIELEQRSLEAVREYDIGKGSFDSALTALVEYEEFYDGRCVHEAAYRETLEDRPWSTCPCGICAKCGIEVAIFRGAERNKRRGFHNVYVFGEALRRHEMAGRSQ